MNNKAKKILFIDPLLQHGHVGFNQIYIQALEKENVEINFVLVKGYDQKLETPNKNIVYSLPLFLFKLNLGGIVNRIFYLIGLVLIRVNVNIKSYDKVIFSSFEEISFYFSGIRNVTVINHINAHKTNSKIKLFFLKKVLKRNTCIVFDKTTKEYLDQKGNFNIVVKPHGFLKPEAPFNKKIFNLDTRLEETNFKHIIFSPSSNSSDDIFLKELIKCSEIIDFLKKNNILLILKGDFQSGEKNILILKKHISNQTYKQLFQKSTIILIAYPESFKYRVSGVLFECFSYNKPCLVKKNDMLLEYINHFCFEPYFDSSRGFIKTTNKILSLQDSEFYRDLDILQPNLKDLLDA